MKRTLNLSASIAVILSVWILNACSLSIPSGDPMAEPTPSSQTAADRPTPLSPAGTPISTENTSGTPDATDAPPFNPLSIRATDCSYGGELESIEALDAGTVRFRLCKPDVAFLEKIAFPAFGIVPGEFLEQTGGGGGGSALLSAPIGSGPYRVESWQPGQELVFTEFENYWEGEQPGSDSLIFRWNLDDSQRLLELQTGTVQGIDNPNSQDYSTIQSDPNLTWIHRPPLSTAYLGMNNTYPPMDSHLVRHAISMAIDRQAIVQEQFPPGFELASFFTPCVVPNGCVGEPWYEYNPQRAKELLAEAGYPDGFQTQISFRDVVRGYLPAPARIAKEIQSQLQRNLNINSRLVPIDSQEFLQAADEGRLPGLFLLGWGADYPDVSNFLDVHFGKNATRSFGNPFFDIQGALEQGSTVPDEEARRPSYEAANNAIRQHIPMIPLVHGGWISPESLSAAFSKSVQGAHANPFSLERFSEMSVNGQDRLAWMQSLEPLSLYCADETDIDSLRACAQVIEPLYRFEAGGAKVEPALAKGCQANAEMTEWTCQLREGVRFHDGSMLDANDVVMSFLVQWDAAHPLHKGRTGEFAYFKELWGAFLNAK